jgi:hypothetical protein
MIASTHSRSQLTPKRHACLEVSRPPNVVSVHTHWSQPPPFPCNWVSIGIIKSYYTPSLPPFPSPSNLNPEIKIHFAPVAVAAAPKAHYVSLAALPLD